MKPSGFENIDAETRSIIVISVAAAFFAWDLGFAPDDILFRYVMTVLGFLAALVGYIVDSNYYRFLTCEDFEISGQAVPANCSRS